MKKICKNCRYWRGTLNIKYETGECKFHNNVFFDDKCKHFKKKDK